MKTVIKKNKNKLLMSIDRFANALKVSGIPEVLERENKRNKFMFVFASNGNNYYVGEDGERISEKDFEKKYPIINLQRRTFKGENSDKRKNWMHNQKSY